MLSNISKNKHRDLSEKVPFQGSSFYFVQGSLSWLAYGKTLFRYKELSLYLGLPIMQFYTDTPNKMLPDGRVLMKVKQRTLNELVAPIIKAAGNRKFETVLNDCDKVFTENPFAFNDIWEKQNNERIEKERLEFEKFKHKNQNKVKEYIAVLCIDNQDFVNYVNDNIAPISKAYSITVNGKCYIPIHKQWQVKRTVSEYVQTCAFIATNNEDLLNLVKKRIK